jgi:hypothetical protein
MAMEQRLGVDLLSSGEFNSQPPAETKVQRVLCYIVEQGLLESVTSARSQRRLSNGFITITIPWEWAQNAMAVGTLVAVWVIAAFRVQGEDGSQRGGCERRRWGRGPRSDCGRRCGPSSWQWPSWKRRERGCKA